MKAKEPRSNDKETRQRLVQAGSRLFGLHGFEATGTRALAQEAGVNLSAIVYHFGGKEGLYRAVLEHVIAVKHEEVGADMARVLFACQNPASTREELLAALRGLVRTMVEVMLGSSESQSFSQIMMQEQIAPTNAYDVCHDGFFARVHSMWAMLLGRLFGLPPDSLELKLRALSVMGQMVIFRVGMTGILKVVGAERLSREHLDCIGRLCVQQVEAMVAGYSPVCPGAAPSPEDGV
ncbi:transcriptional regulator, TetR family [Humidesulfovibrio mexicanus]|uniref:Transcriptional regulator, TetR family n=1 Tax=Humidesulfovibrio mexicanus TaxID=147047 RepID=A0A238YXX7_9BACT|nr:CerR family C-terminal domain-containing protein [Humidesulfovibrio mexicanus]SNR75504.1 transcriptional regulator, TetR family [Humidesulfovibrio mexicanus]